EYCAAHRQQAGQAVPRRGSRQLRRRALRPRGLDAEEPAQGLPGPLVLHARRDRAVELRRPAPHRRAPHPLVRPEHGRDRVRGRLRAAARHLHVACVRLGARHLLRGPRRAAAAADAPLGGDDLHRLDVRAPAPGVLHRRLPQAAGVQLGDRLPPAAPGQPRGLHRLLPPRRPAVGHRHPGRRR
ncbi:MAG: Ubiquinol-cytochrome C reductase, cytochrome B subunit, partial [uncultured Nocardioidaceae bacterium]